MLFQTTQAHEEFRKKVRDFAEAEVKPIAFTLDQNNEFSDEVVWKAAVKFALNVAVCYVVGYGLAKVLVPIPQEPYAAPAIWIERLSKLVGMGLYTVLNYFGQRFFAFKKR